MAQWIPTARIAQRPTGQSLQADGNLSWPATSLNSGNDYSVDFTDALSSGERVVDVVFDVHDAATVAWTDIFGPVVTMWAVWTQAGTCVINVGILTDYGATYQAKISILVDAQVSVIAPQPPPSPGASDQISSWFKTLPETPPDGGGWWNNAGIPTRAPHPQNESKSEKDAS